METVLHSILNLKEGVYGLVFLGMLVEGNATVLLVGFLLNSSVLSPWMLLLSAFCGAFTEQFFWFWFGGRLKNSPSRFAAWLIGKSNHFDEHFFKRPKTTLLLSKFIYGLHRAAITRAAVLEISLPSYLKHITPVLIVWFGVVAGLGYGLGQSFGLLKDYLEWVEFLFLGIFVFVFLLQRYVVSGKLKAIWKKI